MPLVPTGNQQDRSIVHSIYVYCTVHTKLVVPCYWYPSNASGNAINKIRHCISPLACLLYVGALLAGGWLLLLRRGCVVLSIISAITGDGLSSVPTAYTHPAIVQLSAGLTDQAKPSCVLLVRWSYRHRSGTAADATSSARPPC